jgi:predicted nucleic acid-binding protein
MRILLDTNVILDAMLGRPPWHQQADSILEAAARGLLSCAVTPVSIVTVFYVGRRHLGADRAREGVRVYLSAFETLTIDQQTLAAADALPGVDLEDNIQLAAAAQGRLDAFVTRDVGISRVATPVTIWTPDELLQQLNFRDSRSTP